MRDMTVKIKIEYRCFCFIGESFDTVNWKLMFDWKVRHCLGRRKVNLENL